MTHLTIKLLLLVALLLFVSVRCKNKPCAPRKYDEDSVVCVCNISYCDTIGKITVPKRGNYIAYISSKDGYRFHETHGHFREKLKFVSDNLVTINANETQQVIYGWGGAFTDSVGLNMLSLVPKLRKKLLRSYFSEKGIEYSLCRVPIAGSDFSPRFYTYADTPQDFNLTHFKLAEEDYKYKIPFIKAALKLTKNKLNLISSAWCPPLWMKTNGKEYGFGFLKREFYQTWADYHLKFLDAYQRHNISFWALTTGNEPTSAFFFHFLVANVGWTPWEQGKWVEMYLGPAIRNSKYSDLKLIVFDDELVFAFIWLLLSTLLSNAARYIDGIGTHWYFNKILPSGLFLTHAVFPNIFMLNTEACVGDFTYIKKVGLGEWRRGELYVEDIITCMNNWMSGWLEWNLALDEQGGPNYLKNYVDSSVIVNATAQEFYKQTTYYALGHFSKFVPPDSVKISCSTTNMSDRFVEIVAFLRPDNGTTLIIYNKHNEDIPVNIWDPRRGYISYNAFNRSISSIVYG